MARTHPALAPRPESPERAQMSRGERLAFAAGDIFGGGGGALLNVAYFFFLTDVVGLQPGWAGAVVAASKVLDAVSKPVMGRLTDGTRTRWGRRRPWIALGSSLLLPAYLVLWLAPHLDAQAARAGFALAGVLAYVVVATMVTVPYSSMSTETTTSLTERNALNLMRLGFSTLSSALVFVGATALMQAFKAGAFGASTLYLVLAVGFGTLFALPTLLVALLARERTPVLARPGRFRWADFTRGLRVPAYRSLLGLYLCAMLMMDGIGFLLLAYTTYVARIQTALFMGIIILVNLVAVLVSQRLVRTVSKNRIYGTLLPLAVVAGAGIALWPDTWPAWPVYLLVLLLAVGMAGAQLMTWVMFPDVVDAAELQLGERTPGSLSGLMSFVRSLASAALVGVVGLVLQLAGYVGKVGDRTAASQPDTAVWAIRLVLLALVAGFLTTGWWLARRYPLSREVCAEQGRRLAARRGDVAGQERA